jgi:hypothetical protein
MLNIFLGRISLPEYKLSQPAKMEQIIVKEDVRIPCESHGNDLLIMHRPQKSDLTFRVLFYEMSSSIRLVTSRSSPFRTSFTRTWPVDEL